MFYVWTTEPSDPANNVYNIRGVLLHELGHAIGLQHSGFPTAIMFPIAGEHQDVFGLSADDKTAASVHYDTWERLPGAARDIGVSYVTGDAWIIGTNKIPGGYGISKWTGSAWQVVSGAAVRVTVDDDGIPWVVNENGHIYRRTTSSGTSGTWTALPDGATDIGAGGGAVWIVGTNPLGNDFGIFKWNGSSGWVSAPGAGRRIAVSNFGIPWLVNFAGHIYRRTSPNPALGSWTAMPSAGKDVAVGDELFNEAWIIGTDAQGAGGFGIYTWDQQPGDPGRANAVAEWLNVPGAAANISLGPARAWVVNQSGSIYRSSR
jgi:hypothetical protein